MLVAAGSDLSAINFGTTVGLGGAIAPTIGLNVVTNLVHALIRPGASVNAKDDISLVANANEDLLQVGLGLAGGFALGASVDVMSIDNETLAKIESDASVFTHGDMLVSARDNSDIDIISGAIAAGSFAAGAAVGVVTVEKDTQAVVAGGSYVDALGYGTGLMGVMNGEKVGDGDTWALSGTPTNGLVVQATSLEDFTHLTVAVGVAASVGVAGAVTVTVLDSDTLGSIASGAQINRRGYPVGVVPSANQSVVVNAGNLVRGLSFAGALGVGTGAVAGAVDVGKITNDTVAEIAGTASVKALADISVNSVGIQDLRGISISGSAGGFALAASISVWSIGTEIEKNYSDDKGNSSTATEGQGGAAADGDAARQAEMGSSTSSTYLSNYDDDAGNPQQSSRKRVGAITGAAANRISGRAPTQAQIQDSINNGGSDAGTTARITSGATIQAGRNIRVHSNNDFEFDLLVGAIAVGIVGLGAGVSVTSIAANSTAYAAGTINAGGNVNIDAVIDTDADAAAYVGAVGGWVGLGAAVVVMNDVSVAQAYIGANANLYASGDLNIRAVDSRRLEGTTGQLSVGIVAVGASFTKIDIDNESSVETLASIGNAAKVTARNVILSATPDYYVDADTTGVSAGVIAGTVNFAFANIVPETKATIGDGAIVKAVSDISLTANLIAKGFVDAGQFTAGLGTFGGMFANVTLGGGNVNDEVEAGLRNNAQALAGRAIRVTAQSNDVSLANASAGSIGLLSVAGSYASTANDLATVVVMGTGAVANAKRIDLVSQHEAELDTVSDSASFGAVTGKAAIADNELTSRADVNIGSNAKLTSDHVAIRGSNRAIKNRRDSSKPLEDQFRTNLSSKSAAGVNLEVLSSNTDIGTSSNPFQSVVTISPGASITTLGSFTDRSFFEITTYTNFEAIDKVDVESVALLGGISAGLSNIDAVTRSQVIANGARLENKTGDVLLASRGEGINRPESNLTVVAGGSANAAAKVSADTVATHGIEVNNAYIKGMNVNLMAGQVRNVNGAVINDYNSFGFATIVTASLLPNAALSFVHSNVSEENLINISGNSQVVAIQDVELVAKNGFIWSKTDGSVASLSIVPYGYSINGNSTQVQNSHVDIGSTSRVEAGVASTSVMRVLSVPITNLPISRLGTKLNSAEKASLGIPVGMDYEYARLPLSSIRFDIQRDAIFKVVAGANSGGVVDQHYRFLGTSSSAIPHQEDFSNAARWQPISQAEVDESVLKGQAVYQSNIVSDLAIRLTDKFYVVKPVAIDAPQLSYRNMGNLLLEQREELLGWIENHSAADDETLARYEVRLEAIESDLERLGLIDTLVLDDNSTRKVVRAGLDVLFIDMPALSVSPGSVYIQSSGANPATYQAMAGNQLLAHADAKINILNATPFSMTTNGAEVLKAQRLVTLNGAKVVLQPGNVYVNYVPVTNIAETPANTISVLQDAFDTFSSYGVTGLPAGLSTLDQSLHIQNGINNQDGAVNIENVEGSIYVSGEIIGNPVNIVAAGDFSLNSPGWWGLRDARQFIDFLQLDADIANAAGAGQPNFRSYADASEVSDGTKNLASEIAASNSRILSQGRIAITARYLDVNGLIQSGVESVSFNVSSTWQPPDRSGSFKEFQDVVADPTGLLDPDAVSCNCIIGSGGSLGDFFNGIDFGPESVPLNGSWDNNQKAFRLGKIVPDGGEIIIAGEILSTGNGKLKVASGFVDVNINNQSQYPIIFSDIDTTTDRVGKITLVNSPTLEKSEYIVNGSTVQQTDYQGQKVNGRIQYTPIGSSNHSINDILPYNPPEGKHLVWLEGQAATTIEKRIFEKRSFNLVGDNFIADLLAADNSFVRQEGPIYLDQRPLVLSKTLENEGERVPGYADNSAYSIQYVRRDNTVIIPSTDTTQVRVPAYDKNGIVYKYVATDSASIDLLTENYGDVNRWVVSEIPAADFHPDPTQGHFEQNNSILTTEHYVSGGGWLRTKTVTSILTFNRGVKDFYTHTLKADYPIELSFAAGSSAPRIDITSKAGIRFEGNVRIPTNGSIQLNSSQGAVTMAEEAAIYGASPVVSSGKNVVLQIEGNQGPLYVNAVGDITLTAVSQDNASSQFSVASINSATGNVWLTAQHGIASAFSTSLIAGSQISLYSANGSLGTEVTPLRVNSRVNGAGGVSAWGHGDVSIVETTGDLTLTAPLVYRVSQPAPLTLQAEASVQSDIGNVFLVAANGSIRDGVQELQTPVSTFSINGLSRFQQAFTNAGIAAQTWTLDSVSRPVSPGLMGALYPHTQFLGGTPASVATETLNVKGGRVVLRAPSAGAQIGGIADQIAISNPNLRALMTVEQLDAMANAIAEDVVGVSYGLYRYLGANQGNVDLLQEDFGNTNRWQQLLPQIKTGANPFTTISRTVSTGQRVLVEFDRDTYGIYEYLASNSTIDLATQDYTDSSRWRKLDGAYQTGDTPFDLANGDLVTNRRVVTAITLQRASDLDLDAAVGLTAFAYQHIAITAPDNLLLERVVSGGNVVLTATVGNLIDLGTDTAAALASPGKVTLVAGEAISQVSGSFRTQIGFLGTLVAHAENSIDVLQVSNDVTINGVLVAINQLQAFEVGSPGPISVEVAEGDLLVRRVDSDFSIDLQAAGSIYDALSDSTGRFLNLRTSTAVGLANGNVHLVAGGLIGSSINYLDIQLLSGELTTLSNSHTWIRTPSDVILRNIVSVNGNVTIVGLGGMDIDHVQALLGLVTLTALDSIVDINGDAAADISAMSIYLTSQNGTVGATHDDLEINTADTSSSELIVTAAGAIAVTESEGRLNVRSARSLVSGDVRITTRESTANGENIFVGLDSLVSALDGRILLQAADDLSILGTLSAHQLYLRGDYRNQDSAGTVIDIVGNLLADFAEILTDDDNDTVTVAATVSLGLAIYVLRGDDEVTGGSGSDQIFGGPGRDTLYGGEGDDLLDAGTGIGDHLYGQAGNDRLFGSNEGSETDSDFSDEIYFGDYLDGGIGDDQIWGLAGSDKIIGGDGNDVIDAGAGSDWIDGGLGNDILFSGTGLIEIVFGGEGDDEITGSNVGNDELFAGSGDDRIFGQGGDDLIYGDEGNDYIDAGSGTDIVYGGVGDDVLYAGGGAGDQLYGEDGDDQLFGSVDGADELFGGSGQDRIYGYAGNDHIYGGSGNDILEGGDGDDVIYGDSGRDLIVGGAGHDVLYALNPSGTGADNSVDYVYGDFGTNGNEVGSGRDRIYGDGGIDFLFGEGDDDLLDDDIAVPGVPQPNATQDRLDYGTGESANPTDFVTPTPTPSPTLNPLGPAIMLGQSSLPVGPADLGRWGELGRSASGAGLSGNGAMSTSPSVAYSSSGPVAAWTDTRDGQSAVYVASYGSTGWQELSGSAGLGGVSQNSINATSPNITVTSLDKPTVVWTNHYALGSDIQLAQYDAAANSGAGEWQPLNDSLAAAGVSGTGHADHAVVADTSFGLFVAWIDTSSGTSQVYGRVFLNGNWLNLGNGSDTAGGISAAPIGATIEDLSIAASDGHIALVWSQHDSAAAVQKIYMKQFTGTNWAGVSGSASGVGVSELAQSQFTAPLTHNAQPTVAYLGTDLFVSWQTYVDQSSAIAGARYLNSSGAPISIAPITTLSRLAQPKLIGGGQQLQLLWLDSATELYSTSWDGAEFAELVSGDASGIGISTTGRDFQAVAAAMSADGIPSVIWQTTSVDSGASEIMLRTHLATPQGTVYTASAGVSPQAILDAQDFEPGDVLVIEGSFTGNIVIGHDDSGITIVGAEGATITGSIFITGDQVTLQRLHLTGNIVATDAAQLAVRESTVTGSLLLTGGIGSQITHNRFLGAGVSISLRGGNDQTLIRDNDLRGSIGGIVLGDALGLTTSNATNVFIINNHLSGSLNGLRISRNSSGLIEENDIAASDTAIDLDAAFTGSIARNKLHNSNIGVRYDYPAPLGDNEIYGNTTGIASTVDSDVNGLGFGNDVLPNKIHNNTTGVALAGKMQNQRIYSNQRGIAGSGSLVSTDLDHANVIEMNQTGVSFNGRIEFQKIGKNQVGIQASSGQLIAHNVLYRNATGIQLTGVSDVKIISNTIYTNVGDNVRITASSSRTEIQNNIFWTEDGYNLYVSNDSVIGFFSDYNVLHTSNNGKIGFWTKDFTDILDWQEDIYQFDLHSIGRTSVNPLWSEPKFVNKAADDYRIYDVVARQRFSSPTVDAGNPLIDIALPVSQVNLLANPSFESGLNSWEAVPSGVTQSSNPTPSHGNAYFSGGPNPTTVVKQTIDLLAQGFTSAQLDSHQYSVNFGGRVRSAAEATADTGTLTMNFLDAGNSVLATVSIQSANRNDRWELIGDRDYLPSGARKIEYVFTAVRRTGATNDAYLDQAFVYLQPSRQIVDAGAYGNTSNDTPQNAHLVLRSPDLYKDWDRNKPLDIRWDSFGNDSASLVYIDLFQDSVTGPIWQTRISTGTADDGHFTWIAANSGIDYGTYGLRIQVSLANDPSKFDLSTESFTVPENTNSYFVNDSTTDNDIYTTAIGSNRNTGKISSAPKPYPTNVIRIYSVGANQTISVDHGSYPLLMPLQISNILGIGDDEGFLFRGAGIEATTFSHANPFTVADLIDLNNADFITLTDLEVRGGSHGIWARNNSTNLNISNVRTRLNSLEGLRIDTGSSAQNITGLSSLGNQSYGVYINGLLNTLSDSEMLSNRVGGLYLLNTGAASVIRNEVANNFGSNVVGIYVTNNLPGIVVIGDTNLNSGNGNRVHDNSWYGIYALGNVTVAGNAVYGHLGGSNYGIVTDYYPYIVGNVVFNNGNGIATNSQLGIKNNRVYGNAGIGIYANGNVLEEGNVVYSNAIGIQSLNGTLTNNLIYANSTQAVLLNGGTAALLRSNTIHQVQGDGVRIQSGARNVQLRNNIFWVQTGSALSVSNDSQVGFSSDFNLFHTTGSGSIATWQGVQIPTLESWRTTSFTDLNSIAQSPQFVAVPGADGVVGYLNSTSDGRDDDYHLQSLYGSFHAGSFAPLTTGNGTGAPSLAPGTWAIDGAQSPAIDRGLASDLYGLEPINNGGFINLGAYGGTVQASLSPAQYVTVFSPDGGEIFQHNQDTSIRWRSHDMQGTVKIELMTVGSSVPILTITESIANSGELNWQVPATVTPSDQYFLRVTRNDIPALSDISNSSFTISEPINVYYVNDSTFEAGDWTTAAGSDLNSGTSANSPKASIGGVFAAHTLHPGDVIRVDAGTYLLASNIILTAAASGVRIEGYFDPAHPERASVLNRNNASGGSYGIQFQNADDVTLQNLTITGAYSGIYAASNSDSDGLIVRDSVIRLNANTGIWMEPSNDNWTVTGSEFDGGLARNQQYYHMWLVGGRVLVENNEFKNTLYEAIRLTAPQSVVSNNHFTYVANSINVSNSSQVASLQTVISGNTIVGPGSVGISATANTLTTANSVSGQGTGISSYGDIKDNIVHDNITGVSAISFARVEGNRIFHNSSLGLNVLSSVTTANNRVYDNATGVRLDAGFSGSLSGNFIYNNYNVGVLSDGAGYYSTFPKISNNTIYQQTGNAIQLVGPSYQVQVSSNIISIAEGVAIAVDEASQRSFQSDYNVFQLTGSADLYRWGNRYYQDLTNISYELGFDRNSIVADPQFVDPDGADDRLGFDSGNGLQGSYYATADLSGPVVLERVDRQLEFNWYGSVNGGVPGPGVPGDNFSVRWDGYVYVPVAGNYTFYTQADDGVRLYLDGNTSPVIDQWAPNGFAERSYSTSFPEAGWHAIKVELRETAGDARIRLSWSGPTLAKQTISSDYLGVTYGFLPSDFGADDDFSLQPTSPAVDRGSPISYFLRELSPNGGRTDAGALGNSPNASISPERSIQISGPNGLEKLEQGQVIPIQWRSSGLTEKRPIAVMNAGGPTIESFLIDQYRTLGTSYNVPDSQFTNLSTASLGTTVPNDVFKTLAYAAFGIGNRVTYSLPVPDGDYMVKLYFAEFTEAVGSRVMDIQLNGQLVQDNFDIRAAAGALAKAVSREYSLSVVGGVGIVLDLINQTNREATISAIEILASNLAGTADPRARIDYREGGQGNWTTIATNLPMDRFGRGSYSWQIPADMLLSNYYEVRVVHGVDELEVSDTSDNYFTIANSGNQYYVNDGSTLGDTIATAVGNNANSGKDPAHPMASIAALLAAYDLDAGDVINVDKGLYSLVSNIVINQLDAGVTIRGPQDRSAILDRGNLNSGSVGIYLQNADSVTLENLTIRNGYYGIHANSMSDSDNVTIRNSTIHLNQNTGVYIEGSNDNWSISDSSFDGGPARNQQYYHVWSYGGLASITNSAFSNTIYNAVNINAAGAFITGNTFSNIGTAIQVSNTSSDPALRMQILNNVVQGPGSYGISASTNTLVRSNTVSGTTYGISSSGIVEFNVSHHNEYGIAAGYQSVIRNNDLYGNTAVGLNLTSSAINSANTIHDNNIGIRTDLNFSGIVSGNTIYNNAVAGVWNDQTGYYSNIPKITNNTIFQSSGDAILVTGVSSLVQVTNNILWVENGNAIAVDATAQNGFLSDYNLYHVNGSGNLFRWGTKTYSDLVDVFYELGQETNGVDEDPQFVDIDAPGFEFSVLPTSPSIDRGDIQSYFFSEPVPNGGRINIGATGNTAQATTSDAKTLKLTSVVGLEKYEREQSIDVSWQSSGLVESQPILLLNAAGPNATMYLEDRYRLVGNVYNVPVNLLTNLDLSAVPAGTPAEIYKTLAYSNFGVGNKTQYALPVTDGEYTVRLHFAEFTEAVGSRVFDVQLNGELVDDNFDIRATAGAVAKGVIRDYPITVIGGMGLAIDLINQTNREAAIAAIELIRVNPEGTSDPRVSLQISSGGDDWITIASDLGMNRLGRGNYTWQVPSDFDESTTYRMRVVHTVGEATIEDTSAHSFSIANSGADYYISADGINVASGKSIDQPMKTLAALLDAYNLDIGDIIHVGAGQYSLYRNTVLRPNDSGVVIQGPSDRGAIFNRGNAVDPSYVFDFTGADDVTIEGLTITGARNGINIRNGSDSDRNQFLNNSIGGNANYGIYLGTTTDQTNIGGNTLYGIPGGTSLDDQQYGIASSNSSIGFETQIIGNIIRDHAYSGVYLRGARDLIEGNQIFANRDGIDVSSSGILWVDRTVIRSNVIHVNQDKGIYVGNDIEILDNEIYGHSGVNDWAIYSQGNSSNVVEVRNNVIRNNANGIYGYGQFLVSANQVFGNSDTGILVQGKAKAIGNYVYSNSVGIAGSYDFNGQIANNVVYANINRGILLQNSSAGIALADVMNNTIYQSVGDGIRLDSSARNIRLHNNIVWVEAGYGVYVDANSQTGFTSDYNILYRAQGSSAKVGFWNGAALTDLADWQSASTRDAHSLSADPGFVDIDGADNTLGYVAGGGGRNGGTDDNFYRAKNSPGIDKGDAWNALNFDVEGFQRFDDPSTVNTGRPTLIPTVLESSQFSATGTAVPAWRSNGNYFAYTLPFAFPYYGQNYTSLFVSTEGFVQFGSNTLAYNGANTFAEFIAYPRIAPLWDNVRTNNTGDDLIVDTTVANQVKFRWNATNEIDNSDVQFAVVLYSDGRIRFDYGAGNSNLSPTVGISAGNGRTYQLVDGYDGSANLANRASVAFDFVASVVSARHSHS